MNSTPRRNKYSVDGFVPNNGGRRVGFQGAPPLGPRQVQRVHRTPESHAAPRANTAASKPMFDTPATPKGRSNFPEFTSYTGAHPQANGRRRLGSNRSSDADPGGKASFFKRHNWKKITRRSAAGLAVILLLCGGWLGWKLLHTSGKVFGDSNLVAFLSSSKLKGEDKGRTNILLAGVSTDDPGHEGANLTDSIMLMSLDTKNHKASLLSIPRDLWVNIPGYGHSKINAANAYGDQEKFSDPSYPSGGMGLLEKTLSKQLDLPIHYYVKMNYSALRDGVNAVGGITVNIQSEDKRGLYDPNISAADHGPLRLPNGSQTIDGQTALNLARARGDPCGCGKVAYGYAKSDFARTENQRMELIALKDKITTPGVITNPLKIGQLFDAIGNNVKSDLKPSEIHRLYDVSKETSSGNIKSLSLNDADGKNLLASYTTGDGASALIPAAGLDDFSDIQTFLTKTLSNNNVTKETSKVVVLNGGDTTGLASRESNFLTSKGMTVTSVADAPASQARTSIIDQSKGLKPATRQKLVELYGNNVSTTPAPGYEGADFVVILGQSQQAHSTATTDD